MLITQGYVLNGEEKNQIPACHPESWVEVVNELVTSLLSVGADLTHFLLQTLHQICRRIIPDFPSLVHHPSLGEMSPVLYALPLWYQSETTIDSKPFSYKIHPHSQMYYIKESLCSHALSFTMHLELDWLD